MQGKRNSELLRKNKTVLTLFVKYNTISDIRKDSQDDL